MEGMERECEGEERRALRGDSESGCMKTRLWIMGMVDGGAPLYTIYCILLLYFIILNFIMRVITYDFRNVDCSCCGY